MAYEKGNGEAKTKTYMIMPIKEYTGKEIREICMKMAWHKVYLLPIWEYL